MNIKLDGTRIQNKTDLYRVLDETLHFPEYFGYNLDALYDVLTEQNSQIQIEIFQEEALKNHLGSAFYRGLSAVFHDSQCRLFILS